MLAFFCYIWDCETKCVYNDTDVGFVCRGDEDREGDPGGFNVLLRGAL